MDNALMARSGSGPTARIDIPRASLEHLYLCRELSSIEIAALVGCSPKTVRMRMREYGIKIRELRDAFAVSTKHYGKHPRVGEDSNWWAGGTRRKVGYVQVMAKGHPDADPYGYVFEHRLVAEAKIGRPLRPGEEVHHVNEVKTDNRPENIEVMTKSAHMAMHMRARWASGRMTKGKEAKGV